MDIPLDPSVGGAKTAPVDLHPLIRQQGILVVDDSRVQRGGAIGYLRALGVTKIYEAADGSSALGLVSRLIQPPAIILLDLEMPGMDGIELVQRLAAENCRSRLVVFSSADSSLLQAIETMILELGLPLLGTVQKPLHQDALEAVLRDFGIHVDGRRGPAPGGPPPVSADELTAALDSGLILPHYQPKIALRNGETQGLEALARWINPDGSTLPPARFIDVAEENGLIDRMTLVMLDQVLADLRRLRDANFFPVVAINVSAKSLSDRGFANEIMARVDASGVSPRSLVLELTESAVVSDIAAAIGTLGRLRLKGYGLSIDDYGTGFSSMQLLSRLPFTELKIERSFVRHANEKWNLRVILESALTVGHRLGLATVAEGIETTEELALLASMNCRYAQGYLFAKPMPAEAILDWRQQSRERIRELCHQSATNRAPDL